MMTPEKEKELAAQMRLVARQYCDGAFNKIEYRRRRREILAQCVDQDVSPNEPPPIPVAEPAAQSTVAKASLQQRDWAPYLMVGVTLVVLGVMGFLLLSMT
ncbi:MAG: hypothetical protein VYA55_01485 [Pseudomonadota bacterium]|nr:hypothetical protein [Pseudomonadota bacterium]